MKAANNLFAIACALALGFAFANDSHAGKIEVQFTGLDLIYSGGVLTDGNPGGADLLDTATVKLDGVPATGSPFISGLSIDVDIPGVTNIPVGGGTVTSAAGGSLDLDLTGGNFLSLDLDEVSITYLTITNTFRFAFAGALADIVGQTLPDGLELADSVMVSFSANVQSPVDDGVYVTSFTARGTGEIEGSLIPEPAAALLALLGFAPLAARRR